MLLLYVWYDIKFEVKNTVFYNNIRIFESPNDHIHPPPKHMNPYYGKAKDHVPPRLPLP